MDSLVISVKDRQAMLQSVSNCLPEEGCGLLAGLGNLVYEVIPVENIEHSPVRYRIAPQDQLNAFIYIEDKGWDLLGIYHSHPNGPETLSETDLAEAYYPEAVYVIIAGKKTEWIIRGFSLQNKYPQEIEIKVF